MKYMLDTNICIYIIKMKPINVLKKLKKINPDDVCISSITLSELEYGVQKSNFPERNKLALTEFLVPLKIIPFGIPSAKKYGEIRFELENKGNVIGSMDMLIGAHALSNKLILVTNNEKEFRRIKSLRVQNWI